MNRLVIVLIVAALCLFGALRFYQHSLTGQEEIDSAVNLQLPAGFELYSEMSDSIRPLHEKKKPNQPGDWLERFPEGGQTFAQYVAMRERRPIQNDFSTIYIQPLGEFDETQSRMVEETAEFVTHYFGLPVKTLPPQTLGEIPESARRMRGDTEQLLTNWILNERLKPERPDDAVAMIGFVTCDLWPGDLNWVFGQASLTDRVGVWSLYRNGDPHAGDSEYQRCLKRTLKTAVHEIGHMLGIPHCAAYECRMNGSRSREENDRQPMEFCPECQPKIWWSCGADAANRSRELAEFADLHRLSDDAMFWRQQLERLRK